MFHIEKTVLSMGHSVPFCYEWPYAVIFVIPLLHPGYFSYNKYQRFGLGHWTR